MGARGTVLIRYEEFDVPLNAIFKKAREMGYTIPCKRGCDACCYDAAMATHFEMPPLIEHLRLMPAEEKHALAARIRTWFAEMRRAGLDPMTPAQHMPTYLRAHIPCPLLDREAHACMAYEARPICCRGHHVVNTTPDACANRANVPVVPGLELEPFVVSYIQYLAAEETRSMRSGRDLFLSVGLLPMMLAAVWRLIADPKLSVSEWLAHANEHGIEFELPADGIPLFAE